MRDREGERRGPVRVKAKQSKIYKVDEYYDNPNEWSNEKD